jgi:MerR family mercuric resistance operon transcriptional regulator
MRELTIGQVAREAGVNVQTLRYYERRGLIPKPPRRASGYRQYPEDTVRRIRFIRHAKELGFSLKEVAELLALRADPKTPCSEVRNRARAKVGDIDERIAALDRMRDVLSELAEKCSGRGPVRECPILDTLDK